MAAQEYFQMLVGRISSGASQVGASQANSNTATAQTLYSTTIVAKVTNETVVVRHSNLDTIVVASKYFASSKFVQVAIILLRRCLGC